MLGQLAKLAIALLGENLDPEEFRELFKKIQEEKIKRLESLLC